MTLNKEEFIDSFIESLEPSTKTTIDKEQLSKLYDEIEKMPYNALTVTSKRYGQKASEEQANAIMIDTYSEIFHRTIADELDISPFRGNIRWDDVRVKHAYEDASIYAKSVEDLPSSKREARQVITAVKKEEMNAKICSDFIEKFRDKKYEGVNMTEIEKLIEKLKADIETIDASDRPNKEQDINNLSSAIGYLENLTPEFLLATIPVDVDDRRILNHAKECNKGNSDIEKIFGPELLMHFTNAVGLYAEMSISKLELHAAKNMAALILYMITKKCMSATKSGSYKSLVLRAYVVKLMLDLEPGSPEACTYIENTFMPIIRNMVEYGKLVDFLRTRKIVLYDIKK